MQIERYEDSELVETYTVPDQPEVVVRDSLVSKASVALDVNRAFLALATPTNAQTLAQVKALTHETSALIRLLLQRPDSEDGT